MTLPDERYRALRQMPDALLKLAFAPGALTKTQLREEVRRLLRHYPSEYELARMAEACPELLDARHG